MKSETIIERWTKLIEYKRSILDTIAFFQDLQSEIEFGNWPLFPLKTAITVYWANGNGGKYPYLKVKSPEEVFPIRRRVGRDVDGNWIYEDDIGKSKHLGRPGHSVHISAVKQQVASIQYHLYQEQIDILQSALPKLEAEIKEWQEKVYALPSGTEGIPRSYDAVLGGREGRQMRADRWYDRHFGSRQ